MTSCDENADISKEEDTVIYGFDCGAKASLKLGSENGRIIWTAEVTGTKGYAAEYLELPSVSFAGALEDNGGDASVLWPFSEGVIVTDGDKKPPIADPQYPADPRYPLFPNIMLTQFMAYMT